MISYNCKNSIEARNPHPAQNTDCQLRYPQCPGVLDLSSKSKNFDHIVIMDLLFKSSMNPGASKTMDGYLNN